MSTHQTKSCKQQRSKSQTISTQLQASDFFMKFFCSWAEIQRRSGRRCARNNATDIGGTIAHFSNILAPASAQ
jgi:hypothetical protein